MRRLQKPYRRWQRRSILTRSSGKGTALSIPAVTIPLLLTASVANPSKEPGPGRVSVNSPALPKEQEAVNHLVFPPGLFPCQLQMLIDSCQPRCCLLHINTNC